MSSGINGRCDCPLGRHHAPDCHNYIDVWRECPCPECTDRRTTELLASAWDDGFSQGGTYVIAPLGTRKPDNPYRKESN